MFSRRALLFLALISPNLIHADLVSFNQHPYEQAEVGDLAKIGVQYLGSGAHFDEYTLRVSFDPDILQFAGYKYSGDPGNKKDWTAEPQAGPGWVLMSEHGGNGLHGTLFTLNFLALQPGTSPLYLSSFDTDFDANTTLRQSVDEGVFIEKDRSSITVVEEGSELVNAVPEPSALILLTTVIAITARRFFVPNR